MSSFSPKLHKFHTAEITGYTVFNGMVVGFTTTCAISAYHH